MKIKIGIHNIYTTFVVLLLVSCGSFVTYFTIKDDIFKQVFNLIHLFIPIVILFSIGIFIYTLYHFKFIVISNTGIYSFHPFLLKKKEIKWINLENVKTETYHLGKSAGRRILLNSKKTNIYFSSLEFENFDALTLKIPNGENVLKEITLSFYLFRKNVKSDILEQIIYTVLFLGTLCILVFHRLWLAVLIPFILLYSSIRQIIRLLKILKTLKK